MSDWGYPAHDGVSVRSACAPNSPVIEKLGLHLVRVYPDESPAAAAQGDALRIVTPSGKLGYVKAEDVVPLAERPDLLRQGRQRLEDRRRDRRRPSNSPLSRSIDARAAAAGSQ